MIIKQLNGPVGGATGGAGVTYRQSTETVDVGFTNAQGATITLGMAVCLTTTAASVDGIRAVLPATDNLLTFYGIAIKNVPNNAYGLARAYGFLNSVAIYSTGTSGTNAVGIALGPAASKTGVNSVGSVDTFGPVILMETVGAAINSPGGYAKGFVRAL